jgi:hypothetical protein
MRRFNEEERRGIRYPIPCILAVKLKEGGNHEFSPGKEP